VDFHLPRQAIEELAGPLEDAQAEQLASYGRLIITSSPRVNLVSRRSLDSLPEHFVDSAALIRFSDPDGESIADLGTGAGLPGLVVAILRPSARVTLVDSRRSKVVFLKDAVRKLEVMNVDIVHERIEALAGKLEVLFATARALGEASDILPDCLRLVAPGGRLVLFKGPGWSEEREAVDASARLEGAEIARTETVVLPGYDRATTFVEFHVKRS
jgi:16S rRNA (guanine527-N7)-methyltransferase